MSEFVAFTRKEYWTPFVSPVTVAGEVANVPSVNIAPRIAAYLVLYDIGSYFRVTVIRGYNP